jgi:lycopene beta-cyclase
MFRCKFLAQPLFGQSFFGFHNLGIGPILQKNLSLGSNSMALKHYDYIFAGSGLATLLVVYEMILSGKFQHKSILLLDADAKKSNDRTWCFWDESQFLDQIISHQWAKASFSDAQQVQNLQMAPYRYKMIKGLDFYQFMFAQIAQQPNIQFVQTLVNEIIEDENGAEVRCQNQNFRASKVFNAIFEAADIKAQSQYPLLQQHFVGWFIRSEEAVFDPTSATFMDFSVAQKGNTRFMYVLPTSATEALIEYTLFSPDLLPKAEYEAEIEAYIQKLGIQNYQITEKEQGNIPMTGFKFWQKNSQNIMHIGSAGGWTKASTGFTLSQSQRKAKQLVAFLGQNTDFRTFHKTDKFWCYDLLFIDVLYQNNALGMAVFSALFRRGKANLVFKFLDGETSFVEDLQVMLRCPTWPFVKALGKRILGFGW